MITQDLLASFTSVEQEPPANLQQQYAQQQACFQAQPAAVQQTLDIQARLIAKAIGEHLSPVYFLLPEQIACPVDGYDQFQLAPVPAGFREHKVGDLLGLLRISDLDRCLEKLEADANPAAAIGAGLLRFSTALNLMRGAIADGQGGWMVFDENNNLLVNSIAEAKETISTMRHSMDMLEHAAALAPYIQVDSEFRQKRFGLYRQMASQGRALAHYELVEIVRTIRRRADACTLNRGFNLGLPYFDDQDLRMKVHEFEVIPVGRIGFDPFFVVWAARYQQNEISQRKTMSPSTCTHVLDLLKALENAFSMAGPGQ